MLVDDIITAARRLESFINRVSPDILEKLQPNGIRSKDTLKTVIEDCISINVDSFIAILRYYNTLAVGYKKDLVDSLTIEIKIPNVSDVEIIKYKELIDVEKLVFEIIYTLTMLEAVKEKK